MVCMDERSFPIIMVCWDVRDLIAFMVMDLCFSYIYGLHGFMVFLHLWFAWMFELS